MSALRRRYGRAARGGLRLWRYAPVAGWKVEREVTPETSQEWLRIFKRDAPDEIFMVAMKKPSTESGRLLDEARRDRARGTEWISTPRDTKILVVLRDEPEPFNKSGRAWRAYRLEGGQRYPLFIGEESRAAAARRVREEYPDATIEVDNG